ncbi:hypothetical protein HUJ04_001592 [Dendroctonus ponderosae]|nr:hypothetical protein HUJ04_001592 [Dendroctonus ponderosae]
MSQEILGTDVSPFYQQVQKEFGKTKAEVCKCVEMLLKWTEEGVRHREAPPINYCLFCIVACNFSLEEVKKRIDMYYYIPLIMPKVYSVHPLSVELLQHSKVTYCVFLPKYTQNCERVIFMQLNPNYQPEEFKHEFVLIQFVHILELILQEAECYNWHIVFDWIGARSEHIKKLNPREVYANRVASICGINFPPFLDTMLRTIFLPFLSEKLKSKVKICKNTDILFEMFDKSIIPKDFGGEEQSLEELRILMIKKFEDAKAIFDKIQDMANSKVEMPDWFMEFLESCRDFRSFTID